MDAFTNPQKRVFWGFLLSALAIGILWLCLVTRLRFRDALKTVFDRQVWFSASARADYALMVVNGVLFSLVSPRLLGKSAVAVALFMWLHDFFDGRPALGNTLPTWAISTLFTLTLFVLDDFARYWVHRLLHTIPMLWAFHRVHHSALVLNPITVYRAHPVEGVIFALRGATVQGTTIACFVYMFGTQVDLVTVLGASVVSFAFNAAGSNLRHSPVPIRYWPWLERVFMSPAQHHIHHSTAPQHFDKNFGVILSIWDYVFGSFHHSERELELEFGLGKGQPNDAHSLRTLYLEPFVYSLRTLNLSRLIPKKRVTRSKETEAHMRLPSS